MPERGEKKTRNRAFGNTAGKLYIVATPIGNSEDITDRARKILSEADLVAAEDTRTTMRLFSLLGIENKMVSCHKFNEKKQTDFLVDELLNGKNIALVSDAGTPCISDPGHIVVKNAVEKGIDVVGVSGPSSVVTALSVSGFEFVDFAFLGFWPRNKKETEDLLGKIRGSKISVFVFFESPKRIKKTLQAIVLELPDSEICLCNDLTKMYERIYRGSPQAVLEKLENNPSAEKGEYAFVLHVPQQEKKTIALDEIPSHEAMLIDHIVKNGGSVKEAIQSLQEKYKSQISKKEFYAAALRLKEIIPGLFFTARDE